MSGGISGDFATLARMQRRIANTAVAAPKIAEACAPQFVDETRQNISDGRTLGGRALGDKAATIKRGTKAPLERSGALLGSLESVIDGVAVGVRFGVDYAKYALKDFFPKKTPASWVSILRNEALRVLGEVRGG